MIPALALLLAAAPASRDDVVARARAELDAFSGDLSGVKKAQHALAEVVDARPKDALAHVLLSEIELLLACHWSRECNEERLKDARDLVERALTLDATLPEAHVQKAAVWMKKRDHYGAETAAQQALALKPDYWKATMVFAQLAIVQRQWKVAVEHATKALAHATQKADRAAIHQSLAWALANLPDKKRAEESHRQAIQLLPSSAIAKAAYAHFLLDAGRTDEAIVQGKAALAQVDHWRTRAILSAAYDHLADQADKARDLKTADRMRKLAREVGPRPPPLSEDDPKAFSPKRVMAVLQESPRRYDITSAPKPEPSGWAAENAARAWPQARAPLPLVATNGLGPLLQAQERNHRSALKTGKAAYTAGRFSAALDDFAIMTSAFPADHLGWMWQGLAHFKLGEKQDALAAFVRALAMRPDDAEMREAIAAPLAKLGFTARDRILLPRGRVSPADGGYEVATVPAAHWVAWATCKAAWLGEPDFRQAQGGGADHRFGLHEEQQCIAALASVYDRDRKGGKTPREPAIDQVVAAHEAGLFRACVIWEVGTRVEPNVYAALPAPQQRDVEAYVRRFVLIAK